jgi:hypothetical protein
MKKFVSLSIAMPTEGFDVERLDAAKFAANICRNVVDSMEDGVKVTVDVFDHDGTGNDSIESDNEELTVDDFASEISDAFGDPTSYN